MVRSLNILQWLLILFVPLSFGFGNGVIDTTITTTAIIFLFRYYRDALPLFQQKWFIAFAILWLYSSIRSIFAADPMLSLPSSLPMIRFAVFGVAISYMLSSTPKTHLYIFRAIASSLFVLSTNALMQRYIGSDLFGHKLIIMGSGANEFMRLTTLAGKWRVGYMCAFLSVPLIGYIIHILSRNPTKPLKIEAFIMAICAVLGLLTLVMSGERMPLVVFVLSIGLSVLFIKEIRKVGIMAMLILSLVLGSVIYSNDKVYHRLVEATTRQIQNFSGDAYGKIYLGSIEMWKANPIFGIGMNGFRTECAALEEISNSYRCANHVHNFYIQMLAEGGLIGFGLFSGFIAFLLYAFYRRWNDAEIWMKFSMILVFVKLIPIMPGAAFTASYSSAPLWFAIGLALANVSKGLRTRKNI